MQSEHRNLSTYSFFSFWSTCRWLGQAVLPCLRSFFVLRKCRSHAWDISKTSSKRPRQDSHNYMQHSLSVAIMHQTIPYVLIHMSYKLKSTRFGVSGIHRISQPSFIWPSTIVTSHRAVASWAKVQLLQLRVFLGLSAFQLIIEKWYANTCNCSKTQSSHDMINGECYDGSHSKSWPFCASYKDSYPVRRFQKKRQRMKKRQLY